MEDAEEEGDLEHWSRRLKIVHDWPNEFDEYMTDEREGSGIFSMMETLIERMHGLHPLIKNMILEL